LNNIFKKNKWLKKQRT